MAIMLTLARVFFACTAGPCDGPAETDTPADTDINDSDTDTDTEGPVDLDGDGWSASEDCDDANATVFPGASEVCGNGRDEDCDDRSLACRYSGSFADREADLTWLGGQELDGVGHSMMFVPDIDGDGRDEIALGYGYYAKFDEPQDATIAVFFGGRTQGGDAREADLLVRSTGVGRFGDPMDWGDLDGDGTAEIITDLGWGEGDMPYGAGFLEVDRAGVVEILDRTHVISGDWGDPFWGSFAWKDSNGAGRAAFGAVGTYRGDYSKPAFSLFLAPVTATQWLDADVRVYNDATWTECGDTRDIGDLDGDGLTSIAANVRYVYIDADPIGGIAVFDELPVDGATLSDADHQILTPQNEAGSGVILEPSGDLNGDGAVDLLVTDQNGDDRSTLYVGCVHILPGPLASHDQLGAANVRVCGTEYHAEFGTYATSTGDLDGDGVDDLIASEYDNFSAGAEGVYGRVLLFYGPLPDGRTTSSEADARFLGDNAFDNARWLASGGDFDGDGVDDLAIGAMNQSEVARGGGAVYLFTGGL